MAQSDQFERRMLVLLRRLKDAERRRNAARSGGGDVAAAEVELREIEREILGATEPANSRRRSLPGHLARRPLPLRLHR